MNNLKQQAIRGGFIKFCGEAVSFVPRIVFMVTMAPLLDPKDFGLVVMVTAVTSFYGLFISGGLSAATIQKQTVTHEQISTLFWINILFGTILALLCLLTAPVLVRFYDEPRLFWITVVIAAGFIIGAAGVQHYALLERQMRYVALTVIDRFGQLVSIAVGITMAVAGFGYWALVVSAVVGGSLPTICTWWLTAWIPGRPRRGADIRSMLHFGGVITLNSVVVYVAYNLDKVLLGRYWGADALGLYGRAYQLINVPTETLHGAFWGVAFSALSRVQSDPVRHRSYFLKGYSFINSLTLPTTMFFALFPDDIIILVLGQKWIDVIPIFRLLAPTILIFGITNPLALLMLSLGLHTRSLRIALVIAPLVITAYVVGLPFGPSGVAFAYSAAMAIWLVPHVLWCVHGTTVSSRELFLAIIRPLLSAGVAAAATFAVHSYLVGWTPPLLRFVIDAAIMTVTYYTMLLFVMRQSVLYLDLIKGLLGSPPPATEAGKDSSVS